MNTNFDILIVGGGPAGLSTLLYLQRNAPKLAERTLLIEKSSYPRKKLCGGGISTPGRYLLHELDFTFDFDHKPIKWLSIRIGEKEHKIPAPPGFVVVERATFDHALAKLAMKRGANISEGEAFAGFERNEVGLIVHTDKSSYAVKALVGADGANSKVRRALNLNEDPRLCRMLESYALPGQEVTELGDPEVAYFDFSGVSEMGLQGYTWKFPCFNQGGSAANVGIYDSQIHGDKARLSLVEILKDLMDKEGAKYEDKIQSHPIRYFSDEATFSAPNVLLIGDAAGVEPILGEGISTSLAYGKVAAEFLAGSFERNLLDFERYKEYLLHSPLGKRLAPQVGKARAIYGHTEDPESLLREYFMG